MNNNEYQALVQWVQEFHFDIPKALVQDYSNWRHRSRLARCLLRVGNVRPAIVLLKSIAKESISMERNNGVEMSETEDKIWCLMDLAQAIFQCEKDAEHALVHVNEAVRLAQNYPMVFQFVVRGELLQLRWSFLCAVGKERLACREAQQIYRAKYCFSETNNSILFYAYYFLAEQERFQNKWRGAFRALRKAVQQIPRDSSEKKKLQALLKTKKVQPEERYQKVIDSFQSMDVNWKDNTKIIPHLATL
jgi:tetratricopeptide (TPR) repeat protein